MTKKAVGTMSLESKSNDVEHWLHCYEQMAKIRSFEENVNQLYMKAYMPGLAHLYTGQEAVAVGVCEALTSDDYITSTHRGHGHCLAKGAAVDRMFAELLGKEAGYCRGKGGSMHIADPELGESRRQRHCRRQCRDCNWSRSLRKDARERPGGSLFLRRGCAWTGPALRGHEHGGPLEVAGHLCL